MDVRLPDGTVIRGVPDGTTRAQLAARLQANGMTVPDEWMQSAPSPQYAPSSGAFGQIARQTGLGVRGVAQGLTGLLTMPLDALAAADNYVGNLISKDRKQTPLASQIVSENLSALGLPAPETGTERFATNVVGALSGAGGTMRAGTNLAASAANAATQRVGAALADHPLAQGVGAVTGAGAAQAAQEAGLPEPAQMAAGIIGGMAGAGAASMRGGQRVTPPPTTEQLRASGNAAYARADEAGLVIRPQSAERLKSSIVDAIAEEGGADPTLHSRTTAVLRRVAESEPKTLQDVDRLRQLARDAASSGDPADARLANIIIRKIDSYTDKLSTLDVSAGKPDQAVQALRDARDYWQRFRKSELLDDLVKKAEIGAGSNYTQSGLENALRKRFAQLASDFDEMKRFTPEERAAIEKVAKGGPIENALRLVGRFAPHGPVSSALGVSLGAGVGHMLGGAIGAIEGATAVPLIGEAARMGATRMTRANVARASELVRSGRAVPRREEPVAQTPAEPAAPASAPPRALPSPAFIVTPQGRVATDSALRDIGMTPDVMRAGAAHPGAERPASLLTMLNNQPLALPSQVTLPMGSDALEAARQAQAIGLTPDVVRAGAAHPGAPRVTPPSLLSLPAPTREPIVVDRAGRAGSRSALDQYLSETGLGEVQRARVGAPGQSSRPTETGEPPGLLSIRPPKQHKQAASKAPAFAELSEAPSTAGIEVVEHSLPGGGGSASRPPSGRGLPPEGPSEGALLAQRLAQFPEAFRYPIVRGQGQTLPEVVRQIAPELRVMGGGGLYTITDPATGSNAIVEVQDGAVVLNIARFKEGRRGSAIYQAVGDWAHSNGLRFIGDPEGLSPLAQIRRTSNMLSSALRHDTTEHIEPHALQKRPEVQGVRPLDWRFGDDVHNLNEMVASEVETYRNLVPEIRDVRYNPKTERFEKNGHVFTDADFKEVADRARGRSLLPAGDHLGGVSAEIGAGQPSRGIRPSLPAGRDTLKRVAFLQSGLRPLQVGRLGATGGRQSEYHQSIPPALKGLLYGGAGLGLGSLFLSDDESGEPVGLLGRIPVGVH
jgi:hypothetical protein